MQAQEFTRITRAIRTRPAVWTAALAVIGVVLYVSVTPRLAPLAPLSTPRVMAAAAPAAGPVTAEVIASRSTDKYEYLSDVLRQLAAHAQPTCRDEVSGPHGLQEELARAGTLRAQGNLQDASLVLTAIEKRLDRKFQMQCLKLG